MSVVGAKLFMLGTGVAAVGAGIGANVLAAPWRSDAKERYQDQRYAEIAQEVDKSAQADDGRVIYPFPEVPYRDEGEGYGQVISVMAPGAAGIAAAGFGGRAVLKSASLMGRFGGAAGVIAGVAMLGAVVGGIRGSGQGARRSDERHGIDVKQQVAEVMSNFDRDGDGAIELAVSDGMVPEFERRAPNSRLVSIREDAVKADTDHNQRVDKAELSAYIATIDTDGNDAIEHDEAEVRHPIETYGVDDALLSYIG